MRTTLAADPRRDRGADASANLRQFAGNVAVRRRQATGALGIQSPPLTCDSPSCQGSPVLVAAGSPSDSARRTAAGVRLGPSGRSATCALDSRVASHSRNPLNGCAMRSSARLVQATAQSLAMFRIHGRFRRAAGGSVQPAEVRIRAAQRRVFGASVLICIARTWLNTISASAKRAWSRYTSPSSRLASAISGVSGG